MTIENKLGIWMDHSTAHLMEFITDPIETTSLASKFTHEEKQESINKSEHLMHNKEQQGQADYYKKLGETIKNYTHVLLFGPTDAKIELFNILKADHHFDKIKIETLSTDKMSEHQQHAFVRKHFSRH